MARRTAAILVMAGVIAANALGWGLLDHGLEPSPWPDAINGVAFSPYRADQNPQSGRHPTPQQIDQDLELLARHVRHVRTYSVIDGLEAVPPLAERHGLRVTAGAWIDGREERNEREVAALVAIARENHNVTRILVGNETLLRGDVAMEKLVNYIRRVRTQVSVPVSTAEPWHVWLKYPALGREVDFIAIHILPYWEGLPVDRALDYVMQRYQQVKDVYPTKPVVITEVGWPSDGRMRRAASPTPLAQASFLREFLNLANARGLDYFIMEAFDQPWKRYIEGGVGAYWGLFDAYRQPKFPLVGEVRAMPEWRLMAGASALLALLPILLFLRRWGHLRLGGLMFGAALIQGLASVLAFVIHTGLGQYATFGLAVMWSLMVPLLALLLMIVLAEGVELSEVVWSGRRRNFLPYQTDVERRWPKVSIHVPAYNEPPAMLARTLNALARLDYPDFEVIVIDNNTRDEAAWRPVEAHCATLGSRFRFFHVSPLAGYKAGALNFAMRQTAPDAEIVGVVDSDYAVLPEWLKSVVPYFDRAEVGFVQAPQDHDDWRTDTFKEMMNWEYAGFFQIGMIQRNESDAIIQHGTMTLMRKTAMERAGGWAEWCICEDAEMGLRLLENGWRSIYLDRRFGYGLTPDSFTAYKSQRFRWAYGAVQILKRHWREMLPGSRRRLNPMQRYHFITGWMPWFADALGLVFAAASLAWTLGVLSLPRYFEFPLTLFVVPPLVVFAAKVVQFLWLYKLRVRCSLLQRLGAGLAGMSLTYTIGRAVLAGLFTHRMPFVRTPKHEGEPALMRAVGMARAETLLAVFLWLAAAAVARVYGGDDPEALIWAAVMVVQSLPFAAAPVVASINALPAWRRRGTAGVVAGVPARAAGGE